MHENCFYGKLLSMAKILEETRALGVRVPKKLIKQLKQIALNDDKSLSEVIVPVLEALVAENRTSK